MENAKSRRLKLISRDSRRTGLPPQTYRAEIRTGKIPAYRIGGRDFVDPDEVDDRLRELGLEPGEFEIDLDQAGS
ncbi:MAG: hypothetical protein NXI30_04695 [bacterium]|nr:hypothetical protein [bacterium]